MPLQIGQTLKSRYRIVKLLSQGGFGAVYRAWDINMERPLALKENLDTSPEAQIQFKNEAQILFDLTHPNLPKVIDHFINKGQGQYLVMEYIDGEDLQTMLDRLGGPLPENQTLYWFKQVCEALIFLHSQKPPIIHRDIKPANIKITSSGKAILVDFGIAKIFDLNLRTTVGARAVTPGYSPHEQYGHGKTDIRTDIYALGATLYTLLTGQVPVESINRVIKDSLIPPQEINPTISPGLARAITQAMQMDPDQRPISIKSMLYTINAPATVLSNRRSSQSSSTQPIFPSGTLKTQTTVPARKYFQKWLPWAAVLILGIILIAVFGQNGEIPGGELTSTSLSVAGILENTPKPASNDVENILPSFTAPVFPTLILKPSNPSPLPPSPTIDMVIPPACTQKGQTWASPYDGMILSCVPAGKFAMGSWDGDADESPVHPVYLDAYWMDQNEVTFTQFNHFMVEENYAATPCADGDEYPVSCVSWYDAQHYCDWAGRRLPTEAEWEKAARGGLEGMKYPWGNDTPVCSQSAPNGTQFDNCGTHPVAVKTFLPNGYGLFDMAGNVWEWIMEYYQANFYNEYPPDGWPPNPSGPTSGPLPGMRGGGWKSLIGDLRVSNRGAGNPFGSEFLGFRCVADPGS